MIMYMMNKISMKSFYFDKINSLVEKAIWTAPWCDVYMQEKICGPP